MVKLEEFLKRMRNIYGNKYVVDENTYHGTKEKVRIICPEHGEFWKQGYSFLNGCGCKLCSNKQKSINQTKTTEQFVKEYKEKFPESLYSTENVDYKGNKFKIKMICPVHGEFEIKPNKLLIGQGCRKCGQERSHKKQTKTTERFIEEANIVHNFYYSYEKSEYVNKSTKLIVTCPVHGDFHITPDNHLRGKGCSICSISHLEKNVIINLEKHHIKYEYEKKFEWLKYKNPMSLDFYLPDYNVAIECQGLQHFKPVKFSKHQKKEEIKKIFEDIQNRDKFKKELCETHGLTLFYINYNTEDEDNNKLFNILLNGRE